jgi:putative membrane protein
LWVATRIVPGVTYNGGWTPILGVALVFGAVNTFIRPVAKIVAFPIVIVTLGLFLLVINGFMLWLTSALSSALGLGFHVRGFLAAFLGAVVVSIVSGLLSLMTR